MISLNESWQAQRLQRQQEHADRQQQVRATLMQFQHDRQTQATQLRDTLKLFQIELQLDTQELLAHAAAQRQQQAQQVTQQLQTFMQALRNQTAQLLSMQAADRALMAQQLALELAASHATLSASVATLRHEMQLSLQQLQADIQQQLQANRKQRIQHHIQQMQILTQDIERLQQDVQAYLTDLSQLRQVRAQELRQQLQHEHDRRITEVNALFQELGDFRAELRTFCATLRNTVWGSTDKAVAQPVDAPPTPAVSPASTTPAAPAPAPSNRLLKDASQLEQEIFQYLHQTQGARLTDIETTMSINRFQAVDALRSLIKKGAITQRDRLYLAQEAL